MRSNMLKGFVVEKKARCFAVNLFMAMIVFQRPFRVRPFALLFEEHFDCNEEATYCAICPTALVVVGGVSYNRPDC